MKYIDSKKIYDAYIHGAEHVMRYRSVLNKINVFPVADGDTGTNLQSTMMSIINKSKPEDSVKKTLESIADASIGGARGNSGIILAQYLNGVSMEIAGGNIISMEEFVLANQGSVKYAYNAVSNPVEGTMLTVIKDWAESLMDFHINAESFQELLSHGFKAIEKSLVKTKNQLSVLRKAGVVDSGAKGFVLFIKGFMDSIIYGKKAMFTSIEEETETGSPDIHIETDYRYCVEALVKGCHDFDALRKDLTGLGDSLILAGNERVARVHIHSDNPESIFDIIGTHEEILSQKVDDMKRQSEIVENRKYQIALVTDSIADLPFDIIDDYQINIVPVNISMNGIEYLDKLTISNSKILSHIENSDEFPTSAQPDTKTVENLFSYLLDYYDSIIAITVAAELSGTHNSFKKAAENLDDRDKLISVIDSKQNSGSEGLLVKKCAELIAEGLDHKTIVKEIKAIVPKSKIIVSVSNLTNMIKGGRLGTTSGKIAEKLNLKPIVTLDENGKGTLGGAAFSNLGSRKKLLKLMKKTHRTLGIESYSIVYIDNRRRAVELADILEKDIGLKPSYIMQTSSVIAISAGMGAVAISYIAKK